MSAYKRATYYIDGKHWYKKCTRKASRVSAVPKEAAIIILGHSDQLALKL
jgi:hypothetical protein